MNFNKLRVRLLCWLNKTKIWPLNLTHAVKTCRTSRTNLTNSETCSNSWTPSRLKMRIFNNKFKKWFPVNNKSANSFRLVTKTWTIWSLRTKTPSILWTNKFNNCRARTPTTKLTLTIISSKSPSVNNLSNKWPHKCRNCRLRFNRDNKPLLSLKVVRDKSRTCKTNCSRWTIIWCR